LGSVESGAGHPGPAQQPPVFGNSAGGFADLFIADGFVAAVAVGLVVAAFTLAQIIILAFAALECQRSELAAAV
jgi:hypothetical protein